MIKKICQIPIEFKSGNKSICDLLKETGYFENSDSVTIDSFDKYLKNNDKIIQEWLAYSEDKRTSGGWYIIKKNNSIIVGHLDNEIGSAEEKEFDDISKACAVFIFNEIKSIDGR
jgi:hypothetical protein